MNNDINNFQINQIVRHKENPYLRKIMDIRNGEALTSGADGKIGYIDLNWLEAVSNEELEGMVNEYIDNN